MNCYVCETTAEPGGTKYHVQPAVGICQHCGAAVCIDHAHKAGMAGAPILCPSCAELLEGKNLEYQPEIEASFAR